MVVWTGSSVSALRGSGAPGGRMPGLTFSGGEIAAAEMAGVPPVIPGDLTI